MPAKLVTLSLPKIKVFWNKGYDAIIYTHGTTNKILLGESIYIVDVIMWPKFGNSSISTREVIITSILKQFHRKKQFFVGYTCFKFNNLGLVSGMALTLYTSVAKVLKLEVRNYRELIPTFVEVTGEKLTGGICPILNRVKHSSTFLPAKKVFYSFWNMFITEICGINFF